MKAATNKRTRMDRLDEGDWLCLLLADIHEQVASRPSRQEVARIRRRLLAEIRGPARVAA